jgi:hypothetical protein
MKLMLATLIGLVTAACVSTASAHVVVLTTAIPAVKASDEGQLQAALASAINDAVTHAIGFTPTAVSLESMRRIGDRIYLVLLIVDQDGEDLMRQLAADDATSSPAPAPEPVDAESST